MLGAALVGIVLWLAAGGALQVKYDLYQAIEDESVAGLNLNAPVKYNGVDVGKVRSIDLDRTNPGRVVLLFAIEHGTPIKEDTVAVLKTQGLTGIAYVELSGGAANSPPLRTLPGNTYPVITTQPSLAARLENVLTDALAKIDSTTSNINAILSDDNRKAFTSTLADLAIVARTIAARQKQIDSGIANASRTFDNTAQVTAQIGPAIERVARSADAIEKMGNEVAATSRSAGKTVVAAGKTVEAVGSDVRHFTSETLPELERLMGELSTLSASLRRLTQQTERDPRGFIFGRRPVPPGPGEAASPP